MITENKLTNQSWQQTQNHALERNFLCSALEIFVVDVLYKSTFTYLLTYLLTCTYIISTEILDLIHRRDGSRITKWDVMFMNTTRWQLPCCKSYDNKQAQQENLFKLTGSRMMPNLSSALRDVYLWLPDLQSRAFHPFILFLNKSYTNIMEYCLLLNEH